jgi:hypothetical protein
MHFLFFDFPSRIPNNLPQMTIWILKVSGVDAPWPVMWFFSHDSTSSFRLFEQCIDFFFALYKVTYAELGGTWRPNRLLRSLAKSVRW